MDLPGSGGPVCAAR